MSTLVERILANTAERLKRQANTPRCPYRRVYEERAGIQVSGDACGGKMKPKKFHREPVALECQKCGLRIPIKKAEAKAA